MNETTLETPPSTEPAPPAPPAPPPLTLKEELFRFTERFGHMMSRLLLTVLYVLLVTPAGLFMTLFGDRLRSRRFRGSSWEAWSHQNDSVDEARRQG